MCILFLKIFSKLFLRDPRMSLYLAHSENDAQNTHGLREHLEKTSARAASFVVFPWQAPLLRLACLLHDLGKYQNDFQKYLTDGGVRGSVPHAKWGAMLARCLKRKEVSFAVDGHHAGLSDHSIWERAHTHMGEQEAQKLEYLLKTMLDDTGLSQENLLGLGKADVPDTVRPDILTRFIFSCLTDADWLDTEAHFSPEKQQARQTNQFDADAFAKQVEARLTAINDPGKTINRLRVQARLAALEKAALPTGFFSLNLPTGLGKTLTSFHWALEHAKANDLERVIIVLPYVNIIDQTASQLKTILGEENVLEHHAGYDAASKNEWEDTKKLACENWDYPVVVTTSVQFYETLFSNSPYKCRKLHNIANSVVILDEVQTLNKELVLPTLDMLRDVHEIMNTSFVFCTATLPDFKKRGNFNGIENIVDLVENAGSLFRQTQRVKFDLLQNLAPLSSETLLKAVSESSVSTLVIVNTKKLAREIFGHARSTPGWDRVFHLSTSMCPHHRKAWLEFISAAVKDARQKILVVATQLVEAGVDLDFPCVFRELAPLESIIQAAGRCNREDRLRQLGSVFLFQLEDASYPDQFYKIQAQHAGNLIKGNIENINSHNFFKSYYHQINSLFVVHKPVTDQRDVLNFKTVDDMYRIIDSSTRPVFIGNYGNNGRSRIFKAQTQLEDRLGFCMWADVEHYDSILARINQSEERGFSLTRNDFRAMQPYCVQVFENFLHTTRRSWDAKKNGVIVWNGAYSPETGLNADGQHTDHLSF